MTRWAIFLILATLVYSWPANAQTVQLPSFHIFSYSGTVEVPDSGSASLGGISHSASNRTQRGGLFPGPAARSGVSQRGGAAISATIIDQHELDRQVSGQTPDQIMAQHQQIEGQRDREARGARAADPTTEGKALVRYARSLYQQGRYPAARESYELAISILEPHLRELAIAEMRRVGLR